MQCWTFLPTAPPSPVAFWARRQAHETTVHRMDAEAALGVLFSAVEPEFAEDGVDELLTGFHARPRSRVRTAEPKVVRVRAADTGGVWTVHLSAAAGPYGAGRHGRGGRLRTDRRGGLAVRGPVEPPPAGGSWGDR